MNKQELIETLEEIKANIDRNAEISDYTDFSRGKKDAYNNTIGLVKQLDEPKKVIVPQVVADWIDDLRGQISGVKLNSGALFMVFIGRQLERYYDGDYSFLTEKVEGWLTDPENKVKLMSAIDNGYEVEKEQFYYVKMPLTEWNDDTSELETKYVYLTEDITSEEIRLQASNAEHGDWKVKLTEERVKSIDERYWLFAVKVDGE
ncbi:TPA: DUF1642 domain-containing protein [Enterococcus faecalis]